MKLFLKDILKEKNMSVNQLHKLTGISRTTLDPLTKDDTVSKKTRIETLERICSNLNIPLSRIVSFDETPSETYSFPEVIYEKKVYSSTEYEFLEDLVLKIKGPKNTTYFLLLIARYQAEDYFEEENEQLFNKLDDIIHYEPEFPEDERRADLEFQAIDKLISEKAFEYEGKFVFRNRAFSLMSLKERTATLINTQKWQLNIEEDEVKQSGDYGNIVGDPAFIDFISSFIVKRFNLKNNLSKISLSPRDPEYFELEPEKRYTPIPRDFFSLSLYCTSSNKDYDITVNIKP